MVKYTEQSSAHSLYSGILHLIHEQMGHINEYTAVSNECFSLSIAIYYVNPLTLQNLLKTLQKYFKIVIILIFFSNMIWGSGQLDTERKVV